MTDKNSFEEKLRLARTYEEKHRYSDAMSVYRELSMWEDVKRCKFKMENDDKNYNAEVGVSTNDFFSFKIVKKIDSGGFSDVYEVTNEGGYRFAMKIPLNADISGENTLKLDGTTIDSFIKEASMWQNLTQNNIPGIVRLYAFDIRPFPWFVMEYMPNGNLRQRMGKLSEKESSEIAIKILDILHNIHHYGYIHRDIKPENILFDENAEPKLTDFGLGKTLSNASKSSQGFSGTVDYSAPEQLSKKKFGGTDWRTDIYQVGAMLYEMLSGRPPIVGEDMGETMFAIVSEEPKPINGVNPELNDIVLKALRKDKNMRWQGAIEFENALKNYLGYEVTFQKDYFIKQGYNGRNQNVLQQNEQVLASSKGYARQNQYPSYVPVVSEPYKNQDSSKKKKASKGVVIGVIAIIIVTMVLSSTLYLMVGNMGTGGNAPVAGSLSYVSQVSDPANGNATFQVSLNTPDNPNTGDVTLKVLDNTGQLTTITLSILHVVSDSTHLRSGDRIQIAAGSGTDVHGYQVIISIAGYSGSIRGTVPP